jgi:CheY-like chemotaxis protein/two-component sensor histidine kinase
MSSAEKARAAVNVLGSTLDQLLTAARYDSGTEAIEIRSVDLTEALRAVHATNAAEADARGVRFDVRLSRHRIVLQTDARAIQRVLSNLVSNGIKFTDPTNRSNSRVLVLARMRGATCRIDVIDTGIGIEASQSEVIWEPYVQLNNVERDRERGLGLGLFLVKQILQQLPGHSIEMRSMPDHGTRFSVNVPAMKLMRPEAEDPVARTVGCLPDLRSLRGAYVLVLEDDRDARLSLEALLCEWECVVSSAATLAELLAAEDEAERLVDVLVFDYRLSGGSNGLDAIARVRERLGYSPHAVLMTGEADIAPLVERAGPDTTVLQKPFAPEALADALLRAVRAARALEED